MAVSICRYKKYGTYTYKVDDTHMYKRLMSVYLGSSIGVTPVHS